MVWSIVGVIAGLIILGVVSYFVIQQARTTIEALTLPQNFIPIIMIMLLAFMLISALK